VNHNHPAEARIIHFARALREHLALMSLGDLQFVDPQERDNDQEPEVGNYV